MARLLCLVHVWALAAAQTASPSPAPLPPHPCTAVNSTALPLNGVVVMRCPTGLGASRSLIVANPGRQALSAYLYSGAICNSAFDAAAMPGGADALVESSQAPVVSVPIAPCTDAVCCAVTVCRNTTGCGVLTSRVGAAVTAPSGQCLDAGINGVTFNLPTITANSTFVPTCGTQTRVATQTLTIFNPEGVFLTAYMTAPPFCNMYPGAASFGRYAMVRSNDAVNVGTVDSGCSGGACCVVFWCFSREDFGCDGVSYRLSYTAAGTTA